MKAGEGPLPLAQGAAEGHLSSKAQFSHSGGQETKKGQLPVVGQQGQQQILAVWAHVPIKSRPLHELFLPGPQQQVSLT